MSGQPQSAEYTYAIVPTTPPWLLLVVDQTDAAARKLFTDEARTWELKDWKASPDTQAQFVVEAEWLVVRIVVEPVTGAKGYLFTVRLGQNARRELPRRALPFPQITIGLVPNSLRYLRSWPRP